MREIYQEAINLIKSALSNETFTGSVKPEMFKLMRENGLAGTVFKALDKETTDESTYRLFKEEYYMYIKKDQRQLQVIEELRGIFNDNGIDFIFLKGSYLKSIYPESYMRSMGDIDCLIKPDKMKLVHEILKDNGYKNWVVSNNHDCFMKYKDINVEIHPKLDSEFTSGYELLFENPWDNAYKVDGNEYVFNIEFNLLYQIYHMIKHIYSSGVGYRTIVDIYIMLRFHRKTFKNEQFEGLLVNFKHKDFLYFILGYINVKIMDNLLSIKYDYDKINDKYFDNFTDFVMVSGIHGIGEDYNLFTGGIANQSKESSNVFFGKIKFLFSRVFLPKKQMEVMYPFIRKCGLLLPLGWMLRIFRLVFRKRKSTVRKMKRFSISKEEVKRVESLFNNIGL
ncbi:MAG: hypothetical protein CVV61_06125 [Tenericutes bacterium HGW-Tenericutes-6]|nr:MAG: hypothetical protein CVV61_06125 [Tenericutes bacterium HGW-Tenericutes-6]